MLRSNALTRRGGLGAALLVAVLAAFALLPGCNDPQAPAPATPTGPDDYQGSYGTSGILEFRLDVAGGDSRTLRLVASGLVYDADAQQLHVQVAIRNAGTQPVAGPGRVLLSDFDPQVVQPVNAEPLACPACIPCPCWPWAYTYAGTYGDDGMLDPGETSTPIEWILDDPAGQSFSFRARLERDATPTPGTIAGKVFVDQNGDGQRQEFEPGISGVTIHLAHGDTGAETTTDVEGHFQFQVTEEGLYEVNHVAGTTECPLAPEHRSVVIVRRSDGTLSGYDRADFACRRELPPPMILFHGFVFEDLDRDGQRSPNEPGVPNVLVYAEAANCPTFAPIQVRTDRLGAYRLPLPGGCPPPYRVGHETVPGFDDTTPNPLVFDTAPPDSGDVPMPPPTPDPNRPPGDPRPPGREFRPIRADFGIAASDSIPGDALIVGLVFDDLNSNGVADPLEPGLPGVAIGIGGLQCGAPDIMKRTDEQGRYAVRINEMPCPPPWQIRREEIAGRCDTTPNPVIIRGPSIGLPPRAISVDFGSAVCDPPVPGEPILGGTVFDDLDRDGVRDRGEPGVPGVTLRALSPCDAIWETVTDAQGNYAFTNIGCPVLGAQIVQPEFAHYTTPNPAFIRPNAEPHTIHFGVARGR